MYTLSRLSLRPVRRPIRRPVRLLVWLFRAVKLRRQRARLLMLDEHLLRDIGVTPDEAQVEAARPIWDAPARWRD
ncbi:MAG: DUF1127 domain-containing protein [Rhodobacter sp.]|nr:DUF1127 domain-containing protein [Rhodobacter sp.]MBK8440002.1 DUF1127 domain-containing protein [Rhodobacter sp.]